MMATVSKTVTADWWKRAGSWSKSTCRVSVKATSPSYKETHLHYEDDDEVQIQSNSIQTIRGTLGQ